MLILMGQLGRRITDAMQAEIDDPVLAGNAPTMVLCSLDLHGATRPSELAALLGFTTGGVSKLLDRLEAAQLVERTDAHLADHRAVGVRITARGRRLVRAACDAVDATIPKSDELAARLGALLNGHRRRGSSG